jgi:NADP-dependent 3-hydroxy acid dehydrogenase YdfG
MVLIYNKNRRGISNLEKVALVTGGSSGIGFEAL